MQKLDRLSNITIKDLLIIILLANICTLLVGCSSRAVRMAEESMPLAQRQSAAHEEVCIIIDTYDLVTPIAMTMKDKEDLKKDIANRSESHFKQYFATKNMKTHFAEECQPNTLRILLNYTMFEVGKDSNDFIFISWNEKDQIKVPYKLKAEVTIYTSDGQQAFDDEQLENGTDLNGVIDAIAMNAESHVDFSMQDVHFSSRK